MPRALLSLVLLAPGIAWGQDRQFRKIQLADGRELSAEVLSTEAAGLRMRVPQGETLVSFELLKNITPIGEQDFNDQEPMRVWVHSPTREKELLGLYQGITHVRAGTATEPGDLAPGLALQLDQCAADLGCMAGILEGQNWMWLVTSMPPTDDTEAVEILRARTSGGSAITRTDLKSGSIDEIWTEGHKIIQLIPPGGPSRDFKALMAGEAPRPVRGGAKSGGGAGIGRVLVGAAIGAVFCGGATAAGLAMTDTLKGPSAAYPGAMAGLGALVGGAVASGTGRKSPGVAVQASTRF